MRLTCIVTLALLFSASKPLQAHEHRALAEKDLQITSLVFGVAACAVGVSYLCDIVMNKQLADLIELRYSRKRTGDNAVCYSMRFMPSCGIEVKKAQPDGTMVCTHQFGYIVDSKSQKRSWPAQLACAALPLVLFGYGVCLLKEQIPFILKSRIPSR